MKHLYKVSMYLVGVFLACFGVILSKVAGLGISPVSSLPYTLSLIFHSTLGNISMVVYGVFVFIQAIILKGKFKVIECSQIGCAFLLGSCLNFITKYLHIETWFSPNPSYILRLTLCIISCVVIGVGVYIYLKPNYIPMPPEGLVKSIPRFTNGRIPLHKAKISIDLIMVTSSLGLSLIFLKDISTVREGTVIAAILVGTVIGQCKKLEDKLKIKFN